MSESAANGAAVKKFTDFLEQGHYRKTPERFAILEKVLSLTQPFTIEFLNQELDKAAYHVSRATLYNNVELLYKAGLVRKFHTLGAQMQYQKSSARSYPHLICTLCGKVKDVRDNGFVAMMRAKKFTAFTMTHYSMCVYGICNACARKLKRQEREQGKKSAATN